MAFFNYVNPWPETTHWPLRCSAPGDGMPPCGRADFGPEISCGATCFITPICAPRPAAGSLSRRLQRLAQNAILLHYALLWYERDRTEHLGRAGELRAGYKQCFALRSARCSIGPESRALRCALAKPHSTRGQIGYKSLFEYKIGVHVARRAGRTSQGPPF
jgi:hypothetical protein